MLKHNLNVICSNGFVAILSKVVSIKSSFEIILYLFSEVLKAALNLQSLFNTVENALIIMPLLQQRNRKKSTTHSYPARSQNATKG